MKTKNEIIGMKVKSYMWGELEIVSVENVRYENTNWPEYDVIVKDEFGEYKGMIEVNYPHNILSWYNGEGKQREGFNW